MANKTGSKRAYIICGEGRIEMRDALRDRRDDDLVIAADSGANRLLACGYTPNVVIGDMDSIRPEAMERLRRNCEMVRHPVDKDYTDGELALRLAVERGATELTIVNDLCGRFDQAMGVVALLFLARKLDVRAHIRSARQHAWLVNDHWEAALRPGAVVSLLPWSQEAVVASSGLRWPLCDERLLRAATRGVSNEAVQELVTIDVRSGDLLVVAETRSDI